MGEGWCESDTHIVLVAGPPAAGKSTYIREQVTEGDAVIDYDAILGALGGTSHEEAREIHAFLLRRLRAGEMLAKRVWIHSANPRAKEKFPHHEFVLLDPGRDEVLGRARRERAPEVLGVIEDWYSSTEKPTRREW